jgi:toxin ParE1/3/4
VKHIRLIAPARREFLLEFAYYNGKEAGTRFAAAVEEATTRALAFPLIDSPASKSTRGVFVKDFPFAVIYRSDAEGIVVFAVAHHSRRPGYWQSRAQDRQRLQARDMETPPALSVSAWIGNATRSANKRINPPLRALDPQALGVCPRVIRDVVP